MALCLPTRARICGVPINKAIATIIYHHVNIPIKKGDFPPKKPHSGNT
jgi:hypothetical protein